MVELFSPASSALFKRHWYDKGAVPLATTVKLAFAPALTVWLPVMETMAGGPGGGGLTVRVAVSLVTESTALATTTEYPPAWLIWTLFSVNEEAFAPARLTPS